MDNNKKPRTYSGKLLVNKKTSRDNLLIIFQNIAMPKLVLSFTPNGRFVAKFLAARGNKINARLADIQIAVVASSAWAVYKVATRIDFFDGTIQIAF